MKRVLVTGATGFVGRHVVPLLQDREYEVHAVTSRPAMSNASEIQWHRADLLANEAGAELVKRVRPTHLLHLAWYAEPQLYWTSTHNISWLQASLNLFTAFCTSGGERAVCAGSCAEYDWNYGYCREGITPLAPSSLYGTCKNALWSIITSLSEQAGLSVAWGRLFFLYGAHEHRERLVPQVIRSLLEGEVARCSAGSQVRDFLFIQDAASALVSILDSDITGAINVASGHPVTVRRIIEEISGQLNRPELIALGAIPTKEGDPPLLVGDARRLTAELQWTPQFSIERGIRDTIIWWNRVLRDSIRSEGV